MRFVIPFLGKTKEAYLHQAINDYSQRLQRYVPVEIKVVKEQNGPESDQIIMARQAEVLLAQAASASLTVALDPQGQEYRSEEWATTFKTWENRGFATVCFLIGGHLGLDQRVRQQADLVWSLSRLTFTHEMTRFLLLEQLYRACSIKAGHKYHK
jgi:23S rRNA (pseudouridine1915-N3)-methyltransferase